MDLTVVITNYRRPKNMARIVDALARQTLPHRLFVWDNADRRQDKFRLRADWVVRSSRNVGCSARWRMASCADTAAVVIMDDDLLPTDTRALAKTIDGLYRPHREIVGACGVQVCDELPYHRCPRIGFAGGDRKTKAIDRDERSAIIKGRFLAVETATLQGVPLPPLFRDDGELFYEDDIFMSASLGPGAVLASLQRAFADLPTGAESVNARPGHKADREAERRRHWPGKPLAIQEGSR